MQWYNSQSDLIWPDGPFKWEERKVTIMDVLVDRRVEGLGTF
jgi:hypothetical protein